MDKRFGVLSILAAITVLATFSCTKRKPEEPDYAPNSPFNPYPPDSATNIDHTTLDVTLSWTATDPEGNPLTCDIYLDTLNPPESLIASGVSSSSYFLTGLSYNTTYYWKLYLTDDQGAITSGPVWRFTTLPHANTAPNLPTYLYPADNASWQYPTLELGWNNIDPDGGSDTLYYDVYLGITPEPPLTLFRDDRATIREFTGLNYVTTYYWKIVTRDNHYAYASGPVYSFTTRECPWFYKRDLPSPRYGFGTAVVNDKVYVIGGYDGFNYLAEVLEYDPSLDTWTRKADMPTPRGQLAVTVWNGKIYVLGGSTGIFEFKNSNEAYDPSADSWEVLTATPASHYWATAHALNGTISFIGCTPSIGEPFTGIYEYSISENDWGNSLTIRYDTVWTDTTFTVIDTINIDTIRDYRKSELPSAKIYHCSVVFDDHIYILGGITKEGILPPTVDVYHPEANTWTTASDMPGPGNAPAALVANGSIYVIGGYDGYASSKRVRKHDPLANAWSNRSDLQKERAFLGAGFVNNRIYAIGGLSVFPLATVEEYQLDLDPKYIGKRYSP